MSPSLTPLHNLLLMSVTVLALLVVSAGCVLVTWANVIRKKGF